MASLRFGCWSLNVSMSPGLNVQGQFVNLLMNGQCPSDMLSKRFSFSISYFCIILNNIISWSAVQRWWSNERNGGQMPTVLNTLSSWQASHSAISFGACDWERQCGSGSSRQSCPPTAPNQPTTSLPLYKSIQIHTIPYKSIQIHTNPYKSIKIHKNPYKSIQIHTNPQHNPPAPHIHPLLIFLCH